MSKLNLNKNLLTRGVYCEKEIFWNFSYGVKRLLYVRWLWSFKS